MTDTAALIHPTAIIHPSAILQEGVEVGPYAVVGANVEIGARTKIYSHAIIEDLSIIGEDCQISPFSVIGGPPQDLSYKNEPTRVRVGNRTRVRESVTLNRSTGEGTETVIGDDCFLMAYSHVAHNCVVGNNVILANLCQLGGHVTVGDFAFLGGDTVVHQFCRIGRYAILGGASSTRQDLPPFSMNDGRSSTIQGINTVGLRRRGFSLAERERIKKAFHYFWFSGLSQATAVETIRQNIEADPHIEELIEFVLSSKRGIARNKVLSKQVEQADEEELSESQALAV